MNAKQILAVRKATGLNQTDFWSRLGLTQSAGSRYESGRPLSTPVQTLFNLTYVMTEEEAIQKLKELRNGS